jgi:hypothetical protein
MKRLIKEIREQPEHIRHIFMWALVLITFSLVGFTWFRSTQKKFVALLNPAAAQAEQMLAAKTTPQGFSPFATIGNSFKDLQANISELFGNQQLDLNLNNVKVQNQEILPPQKLPIAGDK